MANRYKEFKHLNLPSIEKEILQKWESENAFEKSIEIRQDAQPFVFYEGPPSANGMPGIHHVISRTLKDLVCRYKTMSGFKVQRKGGWDTHGLPVELGVEKELGITKEDIGKKISVAEYNQKCREAVLRYKDKWDDLTTKMGYWVDLKDPYITFTNEYIESLWWCLKQLYQKELLYKSVSIQPYSPAAGTGLSSHELNQPGTYKMVKDTSAIAMFKVVQNEKSKFLFDAAPTTEVFFLAWTTTPWTLPSNLGLTVGSNIDYVLVKTFNPYTHLPVNLVLAKALLGKYFKPEEENGDFEGYTEGTKHLPWTILAEFKGKDLEGLEYEQLLPYEANSLEAIKAVTPDAKPFRVLLGDFVTTEDGTGIVHTAPAFGADDFKVGKKFNIGILTLVDREGKFVDGLGEFSKRYIKDYKDEAGYVDVNVDISVKLKKENRAFKVEKYEHSYPHCWRTDKPVVYYPLDAWFIRTTALRERMVELNKTINWKPKATGEGRFGNWLENMVDWNLSRSRYWGTPLPIWRTEEGTEEKCIGSIEELNAEIRKANEVLGGDVNTHYLHDGILDLHKPYVDDVILVSDSGQPMRREPDLIDVWFDSGAMPYAQWHFPFEKQETFNHNFPADFIAEGVDQTRGWFYTLHALGVMLFDSVAFKTCVSNGLVLDKAGNKMSKRLGNVIDPFKTIADFGADATRWYLVTNASPWDNLKFDIEGIREVQRKFFGTLYNTYQFFALYANVDGFTFKEDYIPVKDRPEIDKWILSSLHTLIKKTKAAFDDYEPTTAGRLIEDFVDEHLSNWYVRLCRRRFWKGEYELDKICAYQTLYECLETVVRLMAPISPFFSDELYRNLNAVTGRHTAESVHHLLFPDADEKLIDVLLEERMQLAQDASSLILSLRKKANIKVRQPLQKVLIPVLNPAMEQQLHRVQELILAEVNVKAIEFLTDTEGFIKKKIKPNFQALGKKLGPKMKEVNTKLSKFSQHDITFFEKEGRYSLPVGDDIVELTLSEVEISSEDIPGWTVASKGPLTVALDINVTPELVQEGDAREFVNRIQKIRKDSGFDVTDRIEVKVAANNGIQQSLAKFNNYICAEILADKLELAPDINDGIEIEVNDNVLKVIVSKKE
ncbi:isoleucine--tRNA ligase [Chitinophagaceae bacterium LB-8]|uniref:Isoleucine--tRNA ligase n=1 Tax=Paraflavisolibacter caeni TaxID=2982496 RepID=A0A9X2XS74_9BACT|nr:isoleucine--tRNA ligase [Paraflavisolibacter caeni]MCU7547665.1 isoleucine--tRNA ligase [Paraflavisolibacter caeni]